MGTLTSSAGLNASYHERCTRSGWTRARNVITFGTNAIGSQDSDHPDIALTRTGTGTYTMTYPPCYEADIAVTDIVSAALTISGGVLTAKSATAGTASLTLHKAGTAADPANGDIVTLTLRLRHRE